MLAESHIVRIAVVSDVHANLAALEAVLRHAEEQRALDAVWSLGDLVGYGPQPSECIAMLRGYPLISVAGNHDQAAVGQIDTENFNPAAATANAWTAEQLGEEDKDFLHALPETLVEDDITLVHGSLRYPVWEYVYSPDVAIEHLKRQQTPYSFVGHTHIPMVFEEAPGRKRPIMFPLSEGNILDLGERRLIMNPGGVGQPRDGDPRAAYAIYDTDDRSVAFYRIPYDIERTQRIMTDAGLPQRLIDRLAFGR